MNEQSLEQLLRQADAAYCAAPQSVQPDTLLTAVRRRRMQTAGVQSIAALAAALAIAVPLMVERTNVDRPGSVPPASDWSLQRPVRPADGAPTSVDSPQDLDALRAELARLDQEADARLQIVAAVMRPNDEAEELESPSEVDGLELLRLETARSAALSLQYAVQMEEEFQDAVAARREYQRVAQRFPGTTWAQVALVSDHRLAAASPDPSTL